MQDIEERIVSVIQRIAQRLYPDDLREILTLVRDHGEFGIAMENLCSILEKEAIPISPQILDDIVGILCQMNFSSEVLTYYKEHLVTSSCPPRR